MLWQRPCAGNGIRSHGGRQFSRSFNRKFLTGPRTDAGKKQRRLSTAATSSQQNASIRLKLNLAKSLDRLDLSNCDLEEIPKEVFELEDLKDLSLAGNRISNIPEEIGSLVSMERFVMAGNLLESLPESIGNLKSLEGFWCHGNLIQSIPDSFGNLQTLKKCSLSGNQIHSLPKSLGNMKSLEILEVAGNCLFELPKTIGELKHLKKLIAHGNQIQRLPVDIAFCSLLEYIMLQGNCLDQIADNFVFPESLKVLNVADNALEEFDVDLAKLSKLETMLLYGNNLKYIQWHILGLSNLKNFWMEGNPLAPSHMNGFANQSNWSKSLQKLGLDEEQVTSARLPPCSVVQECKVCSQGPGYFKLVEKSSSTLVVAFGSAPGEPNWAGLLGRVRKGTKSGAPAVFDTLFVVDPRREWFGGCGDRYDYYYDSLKVVTERYDACIMIGESMGATAALMFSPLATTILAFCPQVDLSFSSIRPGLHREAWDKLRARVMEGVAKTEAELKVMSGTWQHDVKQVQQLDQAKIKWKAFDIDSHRLALYLDSSDKLVPLVRSALGMQDEAFIMSNLV